MKHDKASSHHPTTALLVCIDFDRTLSNETMVDKTMAQACHSVGVNVTAIHNAKEIAERRGESFSTLEYLREHHSEPVIQRVKQEFTAIARQSSLLYDDSLPFLQSLQDRAIPCLVLTQGPNEWQELKLTASNLATVPFKIIAEKDKGKEITGWRTANGLYQAPLTGFAPTRSVVLVDDKAKSFTSLPLDCRGFLLRRPNEQILLSQTGEVPKNVVPVTSLFEVTANVR